MSTILWQWGFALALFVAAEVFVFYVFTRHEREQQRQFAEHLARLRQHNEDTAASMSGDA